jgi:hypothetical protein
MPDPLGPLLEIVRQIIQALQGLPVLLRLLENALWLNAAGLEAVETFVNSSILAFSIVFCAGISLKIGESVELFINRVRPRRFAIALTGAGLITVTGASIWIATIWLIGHFVLGNPHDVHYVIWAVSVGYTPLLFGYMAVLPYLGPIIERVLSLWSFLAILGAVVFIVEVSIWGALLCVLPGWLVVSLLRRFIDRPTVRLDEWWWRYVAGTRQRLDVRELSATLRAQAAAVGHTLGDAHE